MNIGVNIGLLLLSLTANASNIVKVAIVDSGIENADGRYNNVLCGQQRDFTGEGINDTVGHGTAIAGLIKQYAGGYNYCLLIAKYYTPNPKLAAGGPQRFIDAMQWAADHGADIINLSGGGRGFNYPEDEFISTHPNILFVVAAGNNAEPLGEAKCDYFPACLPYPNVIVIGALRSSNEKWEGSNYGPRVDFWEQGVDVPVDGGIKLMTGTSAATAIATGHLLNSMKGNTNGH